ncbi:MarR family winged helix-turn-helix transcriptional regulator [Streptomyces sp. NPDC057674]|uniref:MarR family winged helix-turn-helix transcriptional regulator n=1 Tax=Streptomyces sp. NPDC057674 TaxID=3346203 RepID=UPI0036B4D6A1
MSSPDRPEPQRPEPHRPEPAALAAWHAYRALPLLIDAEVARDLEQDTGLSMADYDVLAAVTALASDDTCIRVSGLAARLHWAHSRLSRHLGRMERRGLVAREPCERDGRGDDVLLTPAGRAAHDEATPVYQASVQRHFAVLLSREQLAALSGIEETVTAHR